MDRSQTFKRQTMIEWTKDFVESEKEDMGKSTALLRATRIQVADDESQVSSVESVFEETQVIRMEEEESESSLVSDTVTQDTELSEPPSNQEDFFVWIKSFNSHMENREQFLLGVLNPFKKVLLFQIFQESELAVRATFAINTTRERLEGASTELNGKILSGRPIVMTFKRVPKKVVTGATKVKARVVSEESDEEDSQEPRIRRGSRKPPGTYSQEQSLPGEGLLSTYFGKLLLRIHLFH